MDDVRGKLEQGRTLTELLITIAIITILITVAIPTYGDLVITNRINTVTSELHGALLYARSEAIKFHGNVVICRSSTTLSENPQCDEGGEGQGRGWGDGWLIFHDADRDKRYSAKDTILRAQPSLFTSSDDGAIVPTPTRNQIVFNATGQTFGSYMRFHIRRPRVDKNPTHDRYLCIASGGRARVSKDMCN